MSPRPRALRVAAAGTVADLIWQHAEYTPDADEDAIREQDGLADLVRDEDEGREPRLGTLPDAE